MTSPRGTLLLVPNTLDLGAPDAPPIECVLAIGVLQHAARLSHWVAEDAKTTRAFLKRVDRVVPLAQALQAIEIAELPRPPKGSKVPPAAVDLTPLLAPAMTGSWLPARTGSGLRCCRWPGQARC
jgi:16S rRNA (cytidine1402-2'-O)-methyltransferase